MSGVGLKRLLTIAGILMVGCLGGVARGQSETVDKSDGPPASDSPPPADYAIQLENGLIQQNQRVWIPGRDGRPVMRFTLDELQQLEQVFREATQMPALLTSADLKIEVDGNAAQVQVGIQAESSGRSIVQRFNLGLKRCQLVESPAFDPPTTAGVDGVPTVQQQVVPTVDGYQWLLLSPQSSSHRLSLVAKTPVDSTTDRRSISVDLPMVMSTIELVLPQGASEERVRSDDLIVNREADDTSVRLQIRSRGGPFTVSWQQERTNARVGAVEAKSDTVYEPFDLLNPTQAWSASTSISIRWNAAETNQKVIIKLPPGGRWNNLPYSEFERFRLTTIPADTEQAEPPQAIEPPQDRGAPGTLPDESSESTWTPKAEWLLIENLEPAEFPSVENLLLEWRWQPPQNATESGASTYGLLAPEFDGVDTHKGTISVIYPGNFEFRYHENVGTRFVQHNQIAELGAGREQIQFAFNQPQAGFEVNFRKEQLLPTIRPTYRVDVGENRIELTVWLRCWFDGPDTEIRWLPKDWTLDESASFRLRDANDYLSNNVEALGVERQEDGSYLLSSRIVEASATPQRVEHLWRLTAYRQWNPGSGDELKFELPAFQRDPGDGTTAPDSGSGVMLLTSANFLLMHPDMQQCLGLWQESLFADLPNLGLAQERTQVYRFQDQGQPPTWVGRAVVLPQTLQIDQQVEIGISERKLAIVQRFDLNVANRPIDQIRLRVREDALPLEVVVGDLSLPYSEVPLASETDGSTSTPAAGLTDDLALPQPPVVESTLAPKWREVTLAGVPNLLGTVRLTVLSSVPMPQLVSRADSQSPNSQSTTSKVESQAIEKDIPLVQWMHSPLLGDTVNGQGSPPTKAGTDATSIRVTKRRVKVTLQSDLQHELQFERGSASNGLTGVETNHFRDVSADEASISVRLVPRAALLEADQISTNGVWLQTMLAGNERRDRFAVRLRSVEQQVIVQLPEHAMLDKVALDGAQLGNDAAPYDYNTNQVTVLLPDANEHVVEVVYLLTEPLTWAKRFRMTPAFVVNADAKDRYYWQLVTPAIYHLGWCPAELTAEWNWTWQSLWWARTSPLDQTNLEKLIGAASLARLPAGTNSYVMSGLEDFPTVNVWILSRFAFWLPVGIFAILMALIVLNYPILRTPNALVLAAGLVFAMSLIWPDMAVLVGQTAFLALFLVALIWLTQAAVESRVGRRSIFSSRTRSRVELSDSGISATRSRPGSFSGSSPSTTAVHSSGVE